MAQQFSDAERAQVLRTFTHEGRITSMPARWTRRLVLLDVVAQSFEPGRAYTEAEVNEVLTGWFEDYAALRRYLVDADYLGRENGFYWRTGGSFDV